MSDLATVSLPRSVGDYGGMPNPSTIRTQPLQGEFRKRVINHLSEIDHALHQALLGVESKVVRQARLVHLRVRVHSGRGDELVYLMRFDRCCLRQDGDDIVCVASLESAVP